MKRNETVNQLTSTHWDVLIVGGGVTGAAILHQVLNSRLCQARLKGGQRTSTSAGRCARSRR